MADYVPQTAGEAIRAFDRRHPEIANHPDVMAADAADVHQEVIAGVLLRLQHEAFWANLDQTRPGATDQPTIVDISTSEQSLPRRVPGEALVDMQPDERKRQLADHLRATRNKLGLAAALREAGVVLAEPTATEVEGSANGDEAGIRPDDRVLVAAGNITAAEHEHDGAQPAVVGAETPSKWTGVLTEEGTNVARAYLDELRERHDELADSTVTATTGLLSAFSGTYRARQGVPVVQSPLFQ